MAKILKLDSTQRVLDNLRERKRQMKLKLTTDASVILNAFLRQPNQLPFADLANRNFKPYAAGDYTGQMQVASLQKWFEDKVLISVGKDKFKLPEEIVDVTLKNTYVTRLKEIHKHYEEMGKLATMCKPYIELGAALEGKTIELDDPSEDNGPSEENDDGTVHPSS